MQSYLTQRPQYDLAVHLIIFGKQYSGGHLLHLGRFLNDLGCTAAAIIWLDIAQNIVEFGLVHRASEQCVVRTIFGTVHAVIVKQRDHLRRVCAERVPQHLDSSGLFFEWCSTAQKDSMERI